MHKVISIEDLTQLFQLPLSVEAFQQLEQTQDLLNDIQETKENDRWVYIWGSTLYSSSKAYKRMIGHRKVHPVIQWLWTSNCQMKHKVFF